MESAWWRSPAARQLRDRGLVVGVFAVGLIGQLAARTNVNVEAAPLTPTTMTGAAAAATVLWWRREHPLLVPLALTAVAWIVAVLAEPGLYTAQIALEVALISFAIGAWTRRPRIAGTIIGLLLVTIAVSALGQDNNAIAASAFGLALIGFPASAGYASRTRRLYFEQVEARLAEAERDRDYRARRAIVDERTRIARELHDVVAHHVSLIGVQAGAARTAMDRSPEATRAALAGIEAASRDAIGEMHRLLDVLQPIDADRAGTDRTPPPDLAALNDLAARWRAAGYDVELHTRGLDVMLPPAYSLCCYRIVEESLTNIARHSSSTRASIEVTVDERGTRISVRDPGPTRSELATAGGGRGHVGMAQRAAIFGGTIHCGPAENGDYVVEAFLPRADPMTGQP